MEGGSPIAHRITPDGCQLDANGQQTVQGCHEGTTQSLNVRHAPQGAVPYWGRVAVAGGPNPKDVHYELQGWALAGPESGMRSQMATDPHHERSAVDSYVRVGDVCLMYMPEAVARRNRDLRDSQTAHTMSDSGREEFEAKQFSIAERYRHRPTHSAEAGDGIFPIDSGS